MEIQSQAQQAYEAIEEMIVSLKLLPGAKVSEKMLGEMLGFGRTPIREALQRLAVEQLIRCRRYQTRINTVLRSYVEAHKAHAK